MTLFPEQPIETEPEKGAPGERQLSRKMGFGARELVDEAFLCDEANKELALLRFCCWATRWDRGLWPCWGTRTWRRCAGWSSRSPMKRISLPAFCVLWITELFGGLHHAQKLCCSPAGALLPALPGREFCDLRPDPPGRPDLPGTMRRATRSLPSRRRFPGERGGSGVPSLVEAVLQDHCHRGAQKPQGAEHPLPQAVLGDMLKLQGER